MGIGIRRAYMHYFARLVDISFIKVMSTVIFPGIKRQMMDIWKGTNKPSVIPDTPRIYLLIEEII